MVTNVLDNCNISLFLRLKLSVYYAVDESAFNGLRQCSSSMYFIMQIIEFKAFSVSIASGEAARSGTHG